MRYSTQIKPISYVKAHAAELLNRITEEREPIIITQNGEARAVLVDVHSYEETQEQLTVLQILAIGEKEIESGQTIPIEEVIAKLRSRKSGDASKEASERLKKQAKAEKSANTRWSKKKEKRGESPAKTGQEIDQPPKSASLLP